MAGNMSIQDMIADLQTVAERHNFKMLSHSEKEGLGGKTLVIVRLVKADEPVTLGVSVSDSVAAGDVFGGTP